MPTAAKAETIEKTRERYQRSSGVIFTEYRGLTVHELQGLRRTLKEKGGELQVVKNTLFRIAVGDHAENLPEELSSGPSAVAYLYEDEPKVAKAILEFRDSNKKFVVKGAFIGGKAFNEKDVESLSKLPAKEVLISQILGLLDQPATGVVTVLNQVLSEPISVIEQIYAEPIRVIAAVADKKKEEEA